MKIVKFHDLELDETHFGISIDDVGVFCSCCGGLFPQDEEHETFEILEEAPMDYLEYTLKEYMED